MKFIEKIAPKNTINRTEIVSLDTGRTFIFHPFIETFNHSIEPKVLKEQFGLFAVTSFYRNGVSDNTYRITIALPAHSTSDARNNYVKVSRLKEFISPDIKALQAGTGMVRMKITPLMPPRIGYITAVQEEIDIDRGFLDGYPKLLRVTIEFQADEMFHEIFGKKTVAREARRRAAAANKTANDKKKKSLGAKAAQAKAKKAAEGKK